MNLVTAEKDHDCFCGSPAVACDLDGDAEDGTAFYCQECFHEAQHFGYLLGFELVELSDGWHVLRVQP